MSGGTRRGRDDRVTVRVKGGGRNGKGDQAQSNYPADHGAAFPVIYPSILRHVTNNGQSGIPDHHQGCQRPGSQRRMKPKRSIRHCAGIGLAWGMQSVTAVTRLAGRITDNHPVASLKSQAPQGGVPQDGPCIGNSAVMPAPRPWRKCGNPHPKCVRSCGRATTGGCQWSGKDPRTNIWFRNAALATACAVVSTINASRNRRRCFSTALRDNSVSTQIS